MRASAFIALAASTFVGVAVIAACDAPPAARRPEVPPGCWLEGAIAAYGDPSVRANCGQKADDAICDDECLERARACVLGSIKERKAFSAMWTNHMTDGVGTRRAVVGRFGDAGYEVTWLEYTYVSAFDPASGTMGKGHVEVKARFCYDLEDLMDACDPRLTTLSERCAIGRARLRDNGYLHCEGVEKSFCAE